MNQAAKIKAFILKNIPKYPQNIVAVTSKHFNVTRMTVHRHIKTLIQQNEILKSGTTRQVTYYLTSQQDRDYQFKISSDVTEGSIWDNFLQPQFQRLPTSLINILHYGCTEMLNNVLDHANASIIKVGVRWQNNIIKITISDNGVGVFQRLNSYFHFTDYRESLLHLTKGKVTTDPLNHTGEGLFFTSRMFDHFYLIANGLCFHRDNVEIDWSVESIPPKKGTHIILEISQISSRKITDIFNTYTSEDFTFNKTELLVDLSQLEGERLISRSQAKRLFLKIEPFNNVVLDFAKVVTVGQGFVDEVFRVYCLKHPGIKIQYINANKDVEFMIKRSLN